MLTFRATTVLILASATALAGCTTYGSNGYGGASIGYGRGYYQQPYYAQSYYGWYDGYYYPGTGYYIYDRQGSRHRWNDRYRHYWEARRPPRDYRENWSGYRRDGRDSRRDRDRDRDRDGRRRDRRD
jgi:hypothetical protein